jgi:gluconate 2-dehydrogenase gamma chain
MDNGRRSFLASSGQVLGAGWLTLNWPAISAAAAHAHAHAASPAGAQTLKTLTAEQARDIEAVSAQIIPTDEDPGAREAGVVYFIDQSLSGFYTEHRPEFLADYTGFAAAVGKTTPGKRFADLPADRQIRYLSTIETTRFFMTTRFLTIVGFLASPGYGGNRDGIGWKVIGFTDEHVFSPPFGYYDRDYPGFVPYNTKSKE